MDLSQPPQDEETKNIIDRLANFVARNGSQFEAMTKEKQRDNPRFQFLFGGEYYNYYTYRVTTEQAILKQQAMRQQQQQMQAQSGGPQHRPSTQGEIQPNFQGGQGQGPRFAQPMHAPGFDRPMQRFDNASNFQQQQNFERERPAFDRPSGGNGFQNFERGPQRGGGGHSPNYDQGSNYERYPSNFGDERPTNFERQHGGYGGSQFEMEAPGPRSLMQVQSGLPAHQLQRPRGPGRFDRGPHGQFERPPGPHGQFERPPGVLHFERPPGPQHFEGMAGPPRQGFSIERTNPSIGSPSLPGPGPIRPFLVDSPGPGPVTVAPVVSQPTAIPDATQTIETLTAQKTVVEEHILQSEKNLVAQHQVLLSQQQTQIEDALRQAQDNEIRALAAELGINIDEFDAVLQPIMDSCTKESISSGKAWIFTHTSTKRHYNLMTSYLLRKTTDPKLKYLERLHLIYLVNDVLHHCMRKGANDLQQALEVVVIPMFCFAKVLEAGNEENLSKLDKLFSLWESKSNYVTKEAVEKLRNYGQTWADYKNDLVSRHALLVAQIANAVQQTFESYQGQHQVFLQHSGQAIKQIEQQIAHLQQQQVEAQLLLQRQQILQQQQSQIPVMRNQPFIPGPGPQNAFPGPGQQIGQSSSPGLPHSGPSYIPPPGMGGDANNIPDLSRPPPGFPPPSDRDLVPALPYFELPAGLMVTLVKLEDDNYKPIDPKAIRLPPPCPPTERLLQAVEAFYGPPSHERPRDSEGWERLGLYEYFKAKNLARKQKEDDIREGRREKSRSPSPIRRDSSPSGGGRSPPRKRYQSKSPPQSKRRKSRSRSPVRRSSRRSRRSRSPSRRSPTPPLFMSSGLGMETKLDESNKGHQLLKKMGWGGTGLGANEQGIEAPIQGGELRERKDQYKGVGISLIDPFESYRKTKGQAFVDRMRQRAEDRS